jgi:hypothetical protein
MKSRRIVLFCFLFCLVFGTPSWAWEQYVWNDTLDIAQIDFYQIAGPVKTINIQPQQQVRYDSGGYIVNKCTVKFPSRNLSFELKPNTNVTNHIRLMLQPIFRKSNTKRYAPAFGVANGNDQWELSGFSLLAILKPPSPEYYGQSFYSFGTFPAKK